MAAQMNKCFWVGLLAVAQAAFFSGCSAQTKSSAVPMPASTQPDLGPARPRRALAGWSPATADVHADPKALAALTSVQQQFGPDPHMAIFTVAIARASGHSLTLTGEVDRAEAAVASSNALRDAGFQVKSEISVLPSPTVAAQPWGLACLSATTGREQPDHRAEMGTQILMGQRVRIWKGTSHWLYVQSPDGYLSWVENGGIARCNLEEAEAWDGSPLLMVTAFETRLLDKPNGSGESVSDLVMGDLVKVKEKQDGWVKVELPDKRDGFVRADDVQDYATWKSSRKLTPENIEATARLFLGRPYLWGGACPKGVDCSGFVKLVFFLNGMELNRNASEQARQGHPIELDPDYSALKKGDLLFFGWPGRGHQPEWITHVAIYLGNKTFIQSSERVRVSSLDPDSPNYDPHHGRNLLRARRVLRGD